MSHGFFVRFMTTAGKAQRLSVKPPMLLYTHVIPQTVQYKPHTAGCSTHTIYFRLSQFVPHTPDKSTVYTPFTSGSSLHPIYTRLSKFYLIHKTDVQYTHPLHQAALCTPQTPDVQYTHPLHHAPLYTPFTPGYLCLYLIHQTDVQYTHPLHQAALCTPHTPDSCTVYTPFTPCSSLHTIYTSLSQFVPHTPDRSILASYTPFGVCVFRFYLILGLQNSKLYLGEEKYIYI